MDRESIASQCMDIHKNTRVSKWISTKAWILKTDIHKTWISIYGYFLFTDIHCGMSEHGYPCLDINVDIHAFRDN